MFHVSSTLDFKLPRNSYHCPLKIVYSCRYFSIGSYDDSILTRTDGQRLNMSNGSLLVAKEFISLNSFNMLLHSLKFPDDVSGFKDSDGKCSIVLNSPCQPIIPN